MTENSNSGEPDRWLWSFVSIPYFAALGLGDSNPSVRKLFQSPLISVSGHWKARCSFGCRKRCRLHETCCASALWAPNKWRSPGMKGVRGVGNSWWAFRWNWIRRAETLTLMTKCSWIPLPSSWQVLARWSPTWFCVWWLSSNGS